MPISSQIRHQGCPEYSPRGNGQTLQTARPRPQPPGELLGKHLPACAWGNPHSFIRTCPLRGQAVEVGAKFGASWEFMSQDHELALSQPLLQTSEGTGGLCHLPVGRVGAAQSSKPQGATTAQKPGLEAVRSQFYSCTNSLGFHFFPPVLSCRERGSSDSQSRALRHPPRGPALGIIAIGREQDARAGSGASPLCSACSCCVCSGSTVCFCSPLFPGAWSCWGGRRAVLWDLTGCRSLALLDPGPQGHGGHGIYLLRQLLSSRKALSTRWVCPQGRK